MELNKLKFNKNNPRLIKDEKFKKLVNSIKEFPKMMSLRPIIYDNSTFEVLGGNMRLKALKKLGYKEIPDNWCKSANELTEDEKKRFVIEDNVGFGEWDYEILANDWIEDELKEWGLDIQCFAEGSEYNNMTDEDVDLEENFDPIGVSAGQQRVVFIFDGSEEAESYLNSLNVQFKKMNMAWQVNMSTQSILSAKDDTK